MARPPKIWWWTERNEWAANVDGKRYRLGADRAAAEQRLLELRLAATAGPASGGIAPATAGLTARGLIGLFFAALRSTAAPQTAEWYRSALLNLVDRLPGTLLAGDIRPHHIETWIRTYRHVRRPLGASGRRHFMRVAKRAWGWAVQSGYLQTSPLARLALPAPTRRVVYLTPEQRALIRESIKPGDPWGDVVDAMLWTGARIQEICRVEARHVSADGGAWVFPPAESKSGDKTGAARVILLTEDAAALTARLVAAWPAGPIFRNVDGKPWHRNAVRCRLRRLRAKHPDKLPADLCAYHLRHAWATDALSRGVDPAAVAALMGHRDAVTLLRHYEHVAAVNGHLRAALRRATQE